MKCPRCGKDNPADIHTCSPQMNQIDELLALADAYANARAWCHLDITEGRRQALRAAIEQALSAVDETHAILDADPSAIIRNAKDGYPDGREPRELTLAERVKALCVYASDWKRWCQEKEQALKMEHLNYLGCMEDLKEAEKALGSGEPVCDKDPRGCWSVRCQLGKVCKNTAPQPQQWVGLTDEEIEREWQFQHDEEGNPPDQHDFAYAIEAALRQKNGGAV
jgi:hypothetical protein